MPKKMQLRPKHLKDNLRKQRQLPRSLSILTNQAYINTESLMMEHLSSKWSKELKMTKFMITERVHGPMSNTFIPTRKVLPLKLKSQQGINSNLLMVLHKPKLQICTGKSSTRRTFQDFLTGVSTPMVNYKLNTTITNTKLMKMVLLSALFIHSNLSANQHQETTKRRILRAIQLTQRSLTSRRLQMVSPYGQMVSMRHLMLMNSSKKLKTQPTTLRKWAFMLKRQVATCTNIITLTIKFLKL